MSEDKARELLRKSGRLTKEEVDEASGTEARMLAILYQQNADLMDIKGTVRGLASTQNTHAKDIEKLRSKENARAAAERNNELQSARETGYAEGKHEGRVELPRLLWKIGAAIGFTGIISAILAGLILHYVFHAS